MKIFLTGGTGFLGSHVARLLRERGDEVSALVRNPGKAVELRSIGCEIVEGDLVDADVLSRATIGCDAVVHGAAVFEVGIPARERRRMAEANIRGTRNICQAALQADVPRLVHVSTVGVFGNTRGALAHEESRHPGEYRTYYEWTKYHGHAVVRRYIGIGLPAVIVLPSTIYGPGDTSQIGQLVRLFLDGRAPQMLFPDTCGFSLVHVEDVARGILLALENGQAGDEYILGGEIATMRALMRRVAELAGKPVPEAAAPAWFLRHVLPHLPPLAAALGFPPNVREAVAGLDGYTWWASHEKAIRELGYESRRLDVGLADMLAREGRLSATPEPVVSLPGAEQPAPVVRETAERHVGAGSSSG